jgi:hypothetical protein
MCGFEFEEGKRACASCPMSAGCRLVCCPHCGYQMIDEDSSTLVRLARSLRERLRGAAKKEVR